MYVCHYKVLFRVIKFSHENNYLVIRYSIKTQHCYSLAVEEHHLQWTEVNNENRPHCNQRLAQSPTAVTDTLRFEQSTL